LRGDDEGGDEGRGDQTVVQAISEKEFTKLHKAVRAADANMASDRGSIGQMIRNAADEKHLHKGAYGIFRRLDKMEDHKRAELLFHLDLYRDRAKWDTSDLFRSAEAAE